VIDCVDTLQSNAAFNVKEQDAKFYSGVH